MKRNLSNKKTAFTLIETLVAISILTIALTGPLAIIAQSLKSSYYARDQITAYYLAQEAVEYIRNQRDFNGLQGVDAIAAEDWLQGVATDSNYDQYDPAGSLVNTYQSGGESNQIKANMVRSGNGYKLEMCNVECPPLKYNATFKNIGSTYALYGDEGADSESIFTREIIFSEPPPFVEEGGDPTNVAPGERELIVTVRVKWSSPSGGANVTIREHLTNWQLEKMVPEEIL